MYKYYKEVLYLIQHDKKDQRKKANKNRNQLASTINDLNKEVEFNRTR